MPAARDHALSIWNAAVNAVRPTALVQNVVKVTDNELTISCQATDHRWDLQRFDRLIVVGGGKATAAMTVGLANQLHSKLPMTGWINIPEGTDAASEINGITVHPARPAGQNEPTAAGVQGTKAMIDLVSNATQRDLCIALISGGGSALMPAPINGITLDDKLQVTRFLSAAGANIQELNTVRKHLSEVKGGGLLNKCNAGELITLVLSDVLGDPLDVIASGPTVPDTSTAQDALAVLNAYDGDQQLSSRIYDALHQSAAKQAVANETPASATTVVIGNNAVAVDAAATAASQLGYQVQSESVSACEGMAEDIGVALAEKLISALRDSHFESGVCFVSGGEPTVKLAPEDTRGKGGRNQQLVLAAYRHLVQRGLSEKQWQRIAILSGGTDGEDGPTDAAGGIIDWQAHNRILEENIDCAEYLRYNDAYHALQLAKGLILTGQTGTNVCDVRVFLVSPEG